MTRPDEWADYLDPAESDPELTPAHREALDRFAAALADEATWSDPPAELRGRILDLVSAEAAAPVPAPRFGATAPPRSSRRPGPRTWWTAAAAVAAAAVLVVALAWPRPHTTTFAMHGTALAPRATAAAEFEPRSAGLAITLEIKGLAPAPAGTYYAAWLQNPDGGVVPVGSFHWRKGGIPIELWSGVLNDRYTTLFVTLQREAAPPAPSGDVVLTGAVPASP